MTSAAPPADARRVGHREGGSAAVAAQRGPSTGRRSATTVALAVVAAHRTGQPLHPELVALGAAFDRVALTAPVYRMIALPGPGVPRGGIVVAADGGTSIEVELHELPTAAIGELLCALPAPLALGRVALLDGSVLGMVCAATPHGSVDISAHGSWPRYVAARAGNSAHRGARQGILTAMDGLPWSEGFEAWKRLRSWHGRSSGDGGAALDALSDIGAVRRLLDQAELAAVRAARGRSKTWAEIATRLGVTRQSAWERWRDLDDEPAPKASGTPLERSGAVEQAMEEAAHQAMEFAVSGAAQRTRRPLVAVPDVVGLEWDTARRVLTSARLAAVQADPDLPPPVAGIGGYVVLDQKPAAGEQVPSGSAVTLWLGRGPGSAGVREPLRPHPTPRATGGAVDEHTGESVP